MTSAVERVVHRRIFALEAERRGMTEDALREQLKAQTGEVTDADVDAFYEANRAQIQQPKEQITDQIRAYLTQQRLQKADADFFAEMEKTYKVDYLLEPLRVEVAATGSARGPATAPVTIVEFSDFQCPYCKRVLPTLDQVAAKYGDKVRVVYPPLPVAVDPCQRAEGRRSLAVRRRPGQVLGDARPAVQRAAEAGRGRPQGEGDAPRARRRVVRASASTPGRHAEAVQPDLRDGAAAGVTGTPAFFVNGRFLNGAVPFESMAELIDDEVRRAERD